MAVNPYALCPCGSGKKLKFCCSDLVAEIEKIHGMVAGGQPHAALNTIEQLLRKQPERVSLLEIKATLELSLKSLDAARETIDTLLRVHPENATSHAHRAILAAATGGGLASVSHLQDALERTSDNMPQRVFEALGAVGQALLVEGELIAARRHLLLYAHLAPEGDTRAVELLLQMNLQAGLPLLMRDQQLLVELPKEDSGEPIEWRAEFEEANRLARRGLWRRAEVLFTQILEPSASHAAVVYNLAMARGWQGKSALFAEGLHAFAGLASAEDDAVEAEALAQLIDPVLEEPQLETVRFSFNLADAEALAEQFAIDRHVENYDMAQEMPQEADLDGNQPVPPRHTYLMLDRPSLKTGVDIEREEVPHVIGFLAIFAKRTDREARLVITTDRGERWDKVKQILTSLAGPSLDGRFPDQPVEEEVVAEKSLGEDSLSWRWRMPDDTPAEQRRKLLNEQRRAAILDQWTRTPRAALNGHTPLEACEDPLLRIPLLASVLLVEQAIADPEERPLLDELREKLKLPARSTIKAAGIDVGQIPLIRIPQLDVASMPDGQLAQLLDRAMMVGATVALLTVATELVGRETVAEDVDLAVAYRQLIQATPNPRQAYQWIDQARAWSRRQDKSEAEWAVQELELSLKLGDSTRTQQLLNEIRDKHLNTPGVGESVYKLLQEAGLVPPADANQHTAGTMPAPHAVSEAAVSGAPDRPDEEAPAIWTP